MWLCLVFLFFSFCFYQKLKHLGTFYININIAIDVRVAWVQFIHNNKVNVLSNIYKYILNNLTL